MSKVLVVDDEAIIRKAFCDFLASNGFETLEASNGRSAINEFGRGNPSLVLLDLNMPDISGIEVLREFRKKAPEIPVIIVTAYGDIRSAVDAIKQGAYDFLSKPLDLEELLITVNRAIERTMLEKKVAELNNTLQLSLESVFGRSGPVKNIINGLCQVAATDFSVLIQGETGTGKTFLAKTMHSLSKRAEMPFVKVSIGSMSETVIESELFGYDKGAFTGAEKNKCGYFEAADKGTLFIDDMDNISLAVQGKLLGTLEDKEICHIGSTVPKNIDIRIIGATNVDLLQAVKEGRFREDLYYRLNELPIHLPPLRERKEDIAFFASKFISETCSELNRPEYEIHGDAMAVLMEYPWPGNLRQLKNVIRRAVLLTADHIIKAREVAFLLDGKRGEIPQDSGIPDSGETQGLSIKEAEKVAIKKALAHTNGQKLKAAALLQITYNTLAKKMQEYGIS